MRHDCLACTVNWQKPWQMGAAGLARLLYDYVISVICDLNIPINLIIQLGYGYKRLLLCFSLGTRIIVSCQN
jgi:hypothetical protein